MNMFKMHGPIRAIDQCIIKKLPAQIFKNKVENGIHNGLKSGGSITDIKGHDQIFVRNTILWRMYRT